MKKDKLKPSLISAAYYSYKNQRKILNELNTKLSQATNREEWTSLFIQRAETLKVANNVNTETGALVSEILFTDGAFKYEYAETFLSEDFNASNDGEQDVIFSCIILEKTTEFYREQHDILRLLPALEKLGRMYSSTVRLHFHDNYEKAIDCFREMLSYKSNYSLIPDLKIRKLFFEAYYTLSCILPILETPKVIPSSAALDYLLEALTFYNSAQVQKLDGNSEEIRECIKRIKENWLYLEYRIDKSDYDTRSAFIKLAHDVYDDAMEKNGYDTLSIPVSVLISYQHAMILEGNTSYIDAVNYMVDYYFKKKKYFSGITEDHSLNLDEFYFETKIPIAMIKWLDKIDILSDMCASLRKRLIDSLNDYYINLSKRGIFSHLIYESVCEWVFFAVNYIPGTYEKEKFLIEMLINRQPQHFFNAYLSADLAVLMTESLYNQKAMLLAPVESFLKNCGMPSEKQDVISFIRKCALFHDIGMNKLNSVEGIQYRRLIQEEKDILQKHVQLGADLFEGGLSIYKDPILGHHKYYDQSEGYPSDIDISNSPLKIICDILSICDALNAGTDNIGRSYKEAKDFSIILSELISFSGTRYNTNLVNLFLDDINLSCQVDSLISDSRVYTYYNYFIKYFDKPSDIV